MRKACGQKETHHRGVQDAQLILRTARDLEYVPTIVAIATATRDLPD
jgi:hypothetical protein